MKDESAELRERQRFLDSIVHNLRASLRGIGTSSELLSREWEARFDEQSKTFLKAIRDGAATLDNLAKALADYSMALLPESSSSAVLPVEYAVKMAMAPLQPRILEMGAEVRCDTLPRLEANHEQLSVLFRCLVSNALDYRDSGRPPRIEISAQRAGEEWRFEVKDNGMGIAPEYLEKVFEPFERLRGSHRSPGLGLAICRKIVEGHGGKIWVESQEGQSATFFFTLPSSGG